MSYQKLHNISSIAIVATLVITFIFLITTFSTFIQDRYTDSRLARSFSSDGATQTSRLLRMLVKDSTSADRFYNYGNTHHFFSFFIAKLLISVGLDLSFRTAAIALAVVQWVSLIATCFFSYLILLKITKNIFFSVWYCALIPSISTSFFYWTYNIHPDIVQVPLLLAAIYLTFLHKYHFLLLSAFCIGLATGTKYVGGLYSLFVGFLFLAGTYTKAKTSNILYSKLLVYAFWGSLGLILAFLLGFILPNWSVLHEIEEFLEDIRYEMNHVSRGHGREESKNLFLWFDIFWNELQFFNIVIVLPVTLLAISKYRKVKNLFHQTSPLMKMIAIASFLTAIAILVHLLFNVNMRRPRYMFHIYPLVILSIGLTLNFIPSGTRRIFMIGMCFVGVFICTSPLHKSINRLTSDIRATSNSEHVKVGKALLKACSLKARILLPQYSYAPPDFENVIKGYRFTSKQIAESNLFLLNKHVPGRYIWPEGDIRQSNIMVKGTVDDTKTQFEVFHKLLTSPSYEILYSSSKLIVMQRKISPVCGRLEGL